MQLTTSQTEKIAASSFLVTGGAGFIGSHIAEFLLNAGARKVRVLDNLDTGHFRNVAPFANHYSFEFLKGDIHDPDTCKAACAGIDYVFHEAAPDSSPGSVNAPANGSGINTPGFLNMLVAARDASVKRIVYASEASVDGDDSEWYQAELITGKPLARYEATKHIYELCADQFAKLYGMESIGLRYFNVFGQRQGHHSGYAAVIPKLAGQLIRHQSPVIHGTGGYFRDFTYVENVVQANMLAMLTTDQKAINQVYNIAFKERTSVSQLVKYLKEFLSVFDQHIAGIKIIHKPAGAEAAQAVGFVDKAKKLLGYQPCYSLRTGLIKSAGWYWTYLPQLEAEEEEIKTGKLEMRNEE